MRQAPAIRQGAPGLVDVGQLLAGPASGMPDSSLRNSWLSLAKIQAHAQLAADPARSTTRGSPPAASSASSHRPFNIKDYADFAEHEGLELVL